MKKNVHNLKLYVALFIISLVAAAASIHLENKSGEMLQQYTKDYIDVNEENLENLSNYADSVELSEPTHHK